LGNVRIDAEAGLGTTLTVPFAFIAGFLVEIKELSLGISY